MQQVNRPALALPARAYQSYQILAPVQTHFRPATCAQARCDGHEHGWRTTVDETSTLGQMQAHYIRTESGRAYREDRDEAGLTVFQFEAGQRCFRSDQHRVPLEREPLFRVLSGTWERSPFERLPLLRRHATAENWRDDMGEHQERIADRIERG